MQPAVPEKGMESTADHKIKRPQDENAGRTWCLGSFVARFRHLVAGLFTQPPKNGLVNSARVRGLLLGKGDGLN